MPVAWTIEYAGQRRPLANWGIRSAQLSFRSLDVDSLSLSLPRADVLAAPAFAYNNDVVLWRNDTRWFSGRVVRPAAAGSGSREADTVLIHGPWWRLQRTVYQQYRCIAGVQQLTPRVTLGQNKFGQRISAGRQIREIVEYALTKGIAIATGALPEFNQVWLEEVTDHTIAGALLRTLRIAPEDVGWFDYSAAVPILNIQPRDLLAAVTLDALAGDYVAEFSLAPRNDLVPAGVTIIYQSSETGLDDRVHTTITRDNAGATNGEGALVVTIDLAKDETAPTGLAGAYWAALQTLPWEGTIKLLEENCTGQIRPGMVVNVSNGRAAWAAMRAVVQGVTEDLFTGETTAELGAPEHLAPQDFIAQQQLARRRPAITTFPVVQPCQIPGEDPGDPEEGVDPPAPVDNPDQGIDPKAKDNENRFAQLTQKAIHQCVDGVDVTVTVYGPPF
jgi:hypothetical protein